METCSYFVVMQMSKCQTQTLNEAEYTSITILASTLTVGFPTVVGVGNILVAFKIFCCKRTQMI